MNVTQEPKYEIKDGRICNRVTGEAIPDDEPIFILRGKDRNAAEAIEAYADNCHIASHKSIVRARVRQFLAWAEDNRATMHEPTSPD